MKHDMLFMWQYYLCMYVVVVIIKAESEISLINCLHPMMCDEIMILHSALYLYELDQICHLNE